MQSSTDYVWKSLLSEFLGTFILVFVVCSAVALTLAQGGSILASAFAYGLALLTIIYVWGPYSGAHVNPAVSFGFAVAGQMNWLLMLGYWIAQLLGGIAAAALVAYFFGTATGAGASVGVATNTDMWKCFLMEAFLTFFLVLAYLFIYRNPFLAIVSGIAIGLVLTFCFLAGGYISGASMNPARSLGPAIFSNNMGSYWIYVFGPLLGALVAALVYKLFTIDFSCCTKVDECGNEILDECGRPLKECKRPLVDNCGNPVKDCNGCQEWDTYTKHERRLTHMQETPLMYAGQWMSAHGFDPRYIKQEVDHAVAKVLPNGVIENPKEIVQSVIQSVTPQPSEGSPAAEILTETKTTTITIETVPDQLMAMKSPDMMSVRNPELMSMKNPDMMSVRNPELMSMRNPDMMSVRNPDMMSMRNPDMMSMRNTDMMSMRNPDMMSMRNPDMMSMRNPLQPNSMMYGQNTGLYPDRGLGATVQSAAADALRLPNLASPL